MAGAARAERTLSAALGIQNDAVVAFAGAGGKTAAIRTLLGEQPDARATTTTHLAPSGFGRGALVAAADEATLDRLLAHAGSMSLAAALTGPDRLRSPSLTWHARGTLGARLLLVECDGARRKLVKLPAPHEPCWHPRTDRAVLVLGLAALGAPLADVAHRPEAFGAARRARVTLAHCARMLRRYADLAPPHAPLAVLLSGADDESRRQAARRLAAIAVRHVRDRDPRHQDPSVEVRVVATATIGAAPYWTWIAPRRRTRRPIALPGTCGVLLAAGSGARFGAELGDSKLLARWQGRALAAHAARAWGSAGFAALRVVTGHAAAALRPVLRDALGRAPGDIRFVHNAAHARGLGSSVRAAARSAPPGLGILFGHADQPAIRVATLASLARVGATLRDAIVQPTIGGRPANPVWFPAALRAELERVADRTGGKPVLEAHAERVVRLALDAVAGELADVDRRRDLERLRRNGRRPRAAR